MSPAASVGKTARIWVPIGLNTTMAQPIRWPGGQNINNGPANESPEVAVVKGLYSIWEIHPVPISKQKIRPSAEFQKWMELNGNYR